ncbi:hypothetical protein BJV82DRAFT_607431 [Fennellomyces sp. T-0311]|nr:hypothetical protein BJV82DRAFT_607431 [Fennellomyces sp. T-0311]
MVQVSFKLLCVLSALLIATVDALPKASSGKKCIDGGNECKSNSDCCEKLKCIELGLKQSYCLPP